MADPLRDRLKALVEEWQFRLLDSLNRRPGPATDGDVLAQKILDQLAALLAESEPSPAPKAWGLSGHLQIHPEPVLKLGHEYEPCAMNPDCPGCHNNGCGLPEEAH